MFKKNLVLLVLLVVSLITTVVVFTADDKDEKKYDDKECKLSKISTVELKKAIEDKTVSIIDVNGSKSYAIGHIAGAHELNAEGFEARLPKSKAALIVIYSSGEQLSADKDPCKKCNESSDLREKCRADKVSCEDCSDDKEIRAKCVGNKASTESSDATRVAAEKIKAYGYSNIKCYCPGLKGWVKAGGVLENEKH